METEKSTIAVDFNTLLSKTDKKLDSRSLAKLGQNGLETLQERLGMKALRRELRE